MNLNQYYESLCGFLQKNPILCRRYLKETICKPEQELPKELVPLTAFVLASKAVVSERIDALYDEWMKREVNELEINERIRMIEVPDLERCLTPLAKISYQKLMIILTEKNPALPIQISNLLKKAYPLSCIDDEDQAAQLIVGGYEERNTVISYLFMFLNGIRIFSDSPEDMMECVAQQFHESCILYSPLPYWGGMEYKENLHKEYSLIETVSQVPMQHDADFLKIGKYIENMNEEIKKNHAEIHCMVLSDSHLKESIPKQWTGLRQMPGAVERYMDHPSVKQRLTKEYPSSNQLLSFLYELIGNLGISREELLDAVIPKEQMAWFQRVYERSTHTNLDIPSDYMFLAGIIYVLCNRSLNAEHVIEHYVLQQPAHVEKSESQNNAVEKKKKEVEHLKGKIRKLSAIINELKKANAETVRQKDQAYNILNEKYKSLNEEFFQLMTITEDENLQEADDTHLEKMKQDIRQAKLLFVGGHSSWQNAIQSEFPNFRFLDSRDYTTATPSIFRGIDYIIYNVKWNNHAMFYKCQKLKTKESKFLYIETNNVNRTIQKIHRIITAEKNSQKMAG